MLSSPSMSTEQVGHLHSAPQEGKPTAAVWPLKATKQRIKPQNTSAMGSTRLPSPLLPPRHA